METQSIGDTTTPKRSWIRGMLRPRVSLRFLLLLTTFVAVWIGLHLQRTRRQQDSIAAILDYGGWIRYDYQMKADGSYDPKASSWVPGWLLDLAGADFFHSVVEVNFVYSEGLGNTRGQRRDGARAAGVSRGAPKAEGTVSLGDSG